MKILLSLIICSAYQNMCMDPYPWPELFDSQYDCLKFGYEESIRKIEEMGRKDINEHGIFIRFTCTPSNAV